VFTKKSNFGESEGQKVNMTRVTRPKIDLEACRHWVEYGFFKVFYIHCGSSSECRNCNTIVPTVRKAKEIYSRVQLYSVENSALGRLGSGVRVSVSFQCLYRPTCRSSSANIFMTFTAIVSEVPVAQW